MTITTTQLAEELVRLTTSLDEAQAELIAAAHEDATAENEYRKARANAFLATEGGTIPEREAKVDKATGDERHRAHLAASLSKAALENVRNRRAQMSALQTVSSSVKAEEEFARTGPSAA